jgi:hypothetical protein
VIADRPAARSGRKRIFLVSAPNAVPFVVTNRKEKRTRSDCVSVIYSFLAAYHVAVLRVGKQDGILGWNCWFVEVASEPLLPRRAGEHRGLAL